MKSSPLLLALLLMSFSCGKNDDDKKTAITIPQTINLDTPYQVTLFGHDEIGNYYTYTYTFSDKNLKHEYLTPHGDGGVKSVDKDEIQVSEDEHALINTNILSMTLSDKNINCKSKDITEGLEIRDIKTIQFYSSEEQGENCFGRPLKAGNVEKIKEQFVRILSHNGM